MIFLFSKKNVFLSCLLLKGITINSKTIKQCSEGVQVSDGDGVKMVRLIGDSKLNYVDPFLLLDVFSSDKPQDYIGGFPSHPHRGFETVTYLLAGKMRHKDNAGNQGLIEAGGVQWMTAGRGVVHSEMPEQEDGLLAGFQLWVNLPSKDKMIAPRYQEFTKDEVPIECRDNGTEIRVIMGVTEQGTTGPVKETKVASLFMDVSLCEGSSFRQAVNAKDNTLIYVIDGQLDVDGSGKNLIEKKIALLEQGERLSVTSKVGRARFLLISAEPLNEPMVRAGPFVMNTEKELRQAFFDYQHGFF